MKYITGIAVFVSTFLIVSCNDFINIKPKSQATVSQSYKTDDDFNQAIIATYQGLQDPYDVFWQFSDLRGDDVVEQAPRMTGQIRLDQFAMTPSDDIVENTWNEFYKVIYRANTILSQIEMADVSNVPNKEQYVGEAKFIRALVYFDLVRIWGDVPMITAPISADEASKTGREKVDTIYNEIIVKDLLDAQSKLPEQYSDAGRATRGAATALLGKVYLTRQNFVKAETELQKVTTMGYALVNNFDALFDYTNEHHSEYIFDIEYVDGGRGLGSSFTSNFGVETQDVGGALVAAIKEKYNIQPAGFGQGVAPSDALFAIFDSTDLRKDITAVRGIYDQNGDFIPIGGPGQVTAFTLKYMTSLVDNGDSKANWHVIRYADVLLMYAEALNENGKTNEALGYLNQVRARADLQGYSDLTQEEAREKIYLERRLELSFEGQRWFDLLRTGRAFEVMGPYGMKEHMTVFPIPQDQIDVINDPSVFSQNPGY